MSTVTIKDIKWKRSIVIIKYQAEINVELFLKNGSKTIPMVAPDTPKDSLVQRENNSEANEYEVSLNISNVNGQMLPAGIWEISSQSDIIADPDVLINITDYDRVFRYGQGRCFLIYMNCGDDGRIYIHANHVKPNANPLSRGKRLDLATLVANAEYSFFQKFSVNRNKRVLFFSQTSSTFSDNMRPVYERLIERGFDKDYTIDVDLREEVGNKRSSLNNLKLTKKLASYGYIFVDNYVPIFTAIKPGPDVKLIQLWHAGVGFKSVGYARFGVKGSPNAFLSCHRRYTQAFVGNEGLRDVYAEVFGISKDRIIATGMPRLENFLDEETIKRKTKEIYSNNLELEHKRLILFAPTFRGTGQGDAYYDYDKLDLGRIASYCKSTNSIFLIKWHGFIKEKLIIPEEESKYIKDVSNYSLNDLMYVSDCLITDYSSCYYDYLLLNKPIIFYMYDEATYSASRGVGEKMSEIACGKVVRNMDSLIEALHNLESIHNHPKEYMIDMCLTNGDYKASDRIIDAVFNVD